MNKIAYILLFTLFFLAGVAFSCIEDCPELERNKRGKFEIVNGDGLVSSGTIEVRETEVEIVYMDDENNEWNVLYKITKEE